MVPVFIASVSIVNLKIFSALTFQKTGHITQELL